LLDINKVLCEECRKTWRFGEILSDVLAEKKLTQADFAQQMNYTESVVSRLINAQRLPRWVDTREIKRVTHQIHCSDAQLGKLIVAFICDTIRDRGLCDDQI